MSAPRDFIPTGAGVDFIPGKTPLPPVATVPSLPLRAAAGHIGLLPLVMVMFFSVSGGAYGLEDAIGQSGAGIGLLLIALTPLVWTLPVAFVVGELSTMMPVEGGYYYWVKKGLGRFWGFQEGWWSWTNSFIDMAIYPVLFADYLSTLLTNDFDITIIEDNAWVHWGVTLVIIWAFTWLNVRGIRDVGRWSVAFAVLVLAPFAVMTVIGLARLVLDPVPIWRPVVAPDTSVGGAFGLGLFVVLWNYLGWDGVSTVCGEIQQPRRTFPRALALAIPLVALAYLLPVAAGLSATRDLSQWTEGKFPDIAEAVGGRWLGEWLAIGGLVSAAGLFSALLLANSRVPFVMAQDGYLPRALMRRHGAYGTPWAAIILCSLIYSVFTLSTFADLVVADVIVYAASLSLEFAALIALRRSHPRARRPVRVPGGGAGLVAVSLAPVLITALAVASTLHDEGLSGLILPIVIIASGPLLYPVCRLLFKRDGRDTDVHIEMDGALSPALS